MSNLVDVSQKNVLKTKPSSERENFLKQVLFINFSVQFNRALDVMNQAVTSPGGVLQPGARENIAYLTSTERRSGFDFEQFLVGF